MRISFSNVVPAFLSEQRDKLSASRVWDADLILNSGDFLEITAPSGKGKTMFISLLYGFQKPVSGNIFYGDETLTGMNPSRLAELRRTAMGIVFQDLKLYPELTARENIMMKAGLTSTVTTTKINEMAESLSVGWLLDNKCRHLSQGQMQRVAVIRGLSQSFSWLLLDEPFSHLDERSATATAELIKQRCREENTGLVLTTLHPQSYCKCNESYAL
ncbi:MAG: ATP-binding cassette domain-containing protein [Candidatus Cloacimonetes bacterium]|nr:ATP-binding cassette domain-containing protein [Candidatus Cloacimonadota bacterium]